MNSQAEMVAKNQQVGEPTISVLWTLHFAKCEVMMVKGVLLHKWIDHFDASYFSTRMQNLNKMVGPKTQLVLFTPVN